MCDWVSRLQVSLCPVIQAIGLAWARTDNFMVLLKHGNYNNFLYIKAASRLFQ